MEMSREAKTTIWADLQDGGEESDVKSISVDIVIDHLDKNAPFEINFHEHFESEWISLDAMLKLKKLIDKAVREHKQGFKHIKPVD